jgi:ribonuclease HI
MSNTIKTIELTGGYTTVTLTKAEYDDLREQVRKLTENRHDLEGIIAGLLDLEAGKVRSLAEVRSRLDLNRDADAMAEALQWARERVARRKG